MRLSRNEKAAAMAVLAVTGAVLKTGVTLLKRYRKYMTQKAAAFFSEDEDKKKGSSAKG